MADDVTITSANLLNKLQLQTGEIDTGTLTLLISWADAWGALTLAENSTSVASLSANQATIFEAAKLSHAAMMAVSTAPLNGAGFKAGPIDIKAISEKDKQVAYDRFEMEKEMHLNTLGFVEHLPYVSGAGGDDYMPDGVDSTNIDYGEVQDYPFSTMD